MADDKSEAIIIVTSISLGLSLLAVSLGCYVRLHLIRAFGADDYMMILAMAFNLAFAIRGIAGGSTGLGKKIEYFADKPNNMRDSLRFWWVSQVFYSLTGTAGRASVAISLLRITIVRCLDKDLLLGIVYTHSVIVALCDLTLGILPIFMIWRLQMNRRLKMFLGGILGLGCLAGAAIVVHGTATLFILANIEAVLGITAGYLSTLRPLVRRLRDGSSNPSQGRNTGSAIHLSRSLLARKERQKLSSHESGTRWADIPNDGYKNITNTTTIQGSRAGSLSSRYLPPTVTVQTTFEVSVAEHQP
ncbi:hypothetical protein BDV37DRAFT_273169 [Aspergillus pseudonomiae]|uniref:Rhodopsin domain-containing protein n=1 Tax=Aspergillus pseudonomiae TaxID=1506151 RepID=A0A5N7D6S5_9EURO|nr:uncharacterized protein BDV37DRAFT_273169 [Aspergillus pseudonomiae]KAE8402111.1 hypothetical protein BDV37DRAFT_273169 [Aspergillus pseudonomiae]